MFLFIMGFIFGFLMSKFAIPILALWYRTEKIIKKKIDETNNDRSI